MQNWEYEETVNFWIKIKLIFYSYIFYILKSISISTERVQPILDFPPPKTLKQF